MLKRKKYFKIILSIFMIIAFTTLNFPVYAFDRTNTSNFATREPVGKVNQLKVGDTFEVKYSIKPDAIPVQQDNSKKDIVLVIDTSGSMDECIGRKTKIHTMKKVAKDFIDKFNNSDNVNIGIVEYSSYACKAYDIVQASKNSVSLKKSIDKLGTGGATNIGDGIRTAKTMLDSDTNAKQKYIILMTDGVATAYSRKKIPIYNSWSWIIDYDFSYDYTGNKINTIIKHNETEAGYRFDFKEYVTFNGTQTKTDKNALSYATNIVQKKISDDPNIKSFFLVGFGLDANKSNEDIVEAAGGYYDETKNYINKGKYYPAEDASVLEKLYNEFAEKILKTIHGNANFQEIFNENLEVVNTFNLPYGLKVSENKLLGNIDLEYTLSDDGKYYLSQPIEFTITYKVKRSGVCILGQNGVSGVKLNVADRVQENIFDELIFRANDITQGSMVKIEVNDSDKLKYSCEFNDTINNKFFSNEIKLKRNALVNFSFSSKTSNCMQYQFVNSPTNPQSMPQEGWIDLDVNTQINNDDVITDKMGCLNYRGYDVSHLQTMGDQGSWEIPELVFKYPFEATSYKDTGMSTKSNEYGHWEQYKNYKGEKLRRWVTNTMFMTNMNIGGDYKEASKFWGYIKVPRTGKYYFGAHSDDGVRGYITVNGETKKFVDMFKIQSSTWGTTNEKCNLQKDKYYPIYLEYSNWGGWANLQMKYSIDKKVNEDSNDVQGNWFYPSKSLSPGEYANTIFTGSQGVKFPNNIGEYYIAYRIGNKDNGSINVEKYGFYGPFTFEKELRLTLNRGLNNYPINIGEQFEIKYIIQPREVYVKEIYPDCKNVNDLQQNYTITVNEFKYQDIFPKGLTPLKKNNEIINETKINGDLDINNINYVLVKASNGDISKSYYKAEPIEFSIRVKAGNESKIYELLGEKSILTYVDIDGAKKQANFKDMDIQVGDSTIIWKHGILDKNSPDKQYVKEIPENNYRVTDKVPILMAMVVEVKSSKPQINLKISGAYSAVNNNINFKIYEYKNGVVNFEGDEPIKLNLPTNVLNIRHEKMGTNNDIPRKYIIIYELKPDKSKGDSITIEYNVNGQVSKRTLTLNIVNLPTLQ